MSADNGFVIRKNRDEKFVLQMYFASADTYPPIDAPSAKVFDTLDEAVLEFARISNKPGMIIEYGLSVHVDEVYPPYVEDPPAYPISLHPQ